MTGAPRVAARAPESRPGEAEQYARWVEANFLVAKFRRLAAAEDPRVRDALDLALVAAIHETVRDYLAFRGHGWEGEKIAWQRIDADPAFDTAVRAALRAHDVDERRRRHEELARLACAPVGGLWPEGETAAGWSLPAGDPREARRWEGWFAGASPP